MKSSLQTSGLNRPDFPAAKGTYLVGGAVRDLLLGRALHDWDLLVVGDAEAFALEVARRNRSRVVTMGQDPALTFRVPTSMGVVDIVAAEDMDLNADLSRRDYTINAMAMDIGTGALVDPHGGRKDIESGVLRMVADDALQRDPVRILRGFRFAAELGFSINPRTLSAMVRYAPGLSAVPGERVREALLSLLSCGESRFELRKLADTGILFHVVPELSGLSGCRQNRYHAHDVLSHTLEAYARLEEMTAKGRAGVLEPWRAEIPALSDAAGRVLLKLALLFHDMGKPATRTTDGAGNAHFHGHEKAGARMAEACLQRLRFSHKETLYVGNIIRRHLMPLHLYKASRVSGVFCGRAETRFFHRSGALVPDTLLHALADAAGKTASPVDPAYAVYLAGLMARFFDCFKPVQASEPLLTGHDLIRDLGLCPSPFFRKLLERVREGQLSGQITDRAGAMALVLELCDRWKVDRPGAARSDPPVPELPCT